MVKEVRKKETVQYLMQAEEFLASAIQNLKEKRLNAAGFSAIQSMINANDALTIYHLERRASKDHREAIKMHIDVVKIINDGSQRGRFKEAMESSQSTMLDPLKNILHPKFYSRRFRTKTYITP